MMTKTVNPTAATMPAAYTKKRRRFNSGFLLVVPYLCFMTVFGLSPAIYALILSFAKFELGKPMYFQAGVENFYAVFVDRRFMPALTNTFSFVVLAVPVFIIGVVFLVMLLHAHGGKLAEGMRAIYYLPAAISLPVLVMVLIFFLDPKISPYGPILQWMGFERQRDVLRVENFVVLFTILAFFGGAGAWIAIFYGGLNGISNEVFEAAKMDGCNWWQLALYIKTPLIKPYIWYMTIMTIAANIQIFAQPQIIGASMIQGAGLETRYWSLNQLGYWYAYGVGQFGMVSVVALILVAFALTAAYVVVTWSGFFNTDTLR